MVHAWRAQLRAGLDIELLRTQDHQRHCERKHGDNKEKRPSFLLTMNLKSLIPVIANWPKPGVNFLDITAVLENPAAFAYCVDWLIDTAQQHQATSLVAVESRGFPFAAATAKILNIPLVLARKPNKLPGAVFAQSYCTEYSTDTIEIKQSSPVGLRPLIVDDLLATGGTMAAVADLISTNFDATCVAGAVVVDLEFLNGRDLLNNRNIVIFALETYCE